MKTLKDKITEVTDHIREALVSNEFEFISSDEFRAKVSIDSVRIELWISNGYSSLSITDPPCCRGETFVIEWGSGDDQSVAYSNIMAHVKKASNATNLLQIAELEELIKTKKAQL